MTRILNCMPSQNTAADWRISEALQSGMVRPPSTLPPAVDLRAVWWNVGDQGSTGSCVGWAVADSLCRWHMVQDGRITPEQALSARYVWMAAKEIDKSVTRPTTFIEQEGTSLKSALDVVCKYGAALEEMLPFGGATLYQDTTRLFYASASRLRIAAYFNLENNFEVWRTWLASQGPILTRLDVDAAWDNAVLTNGLLAEYQADTARGGHAVALVGYTPEVFIVRNSWGAAWGNQGYGYATLAYTKAAFTEAYGITV
jgi:hypothetical protein